MPAELYHLSPPIVAYCQDCDWSGEETDHEEWAARQMADHNALQHGLVEL